MFHHARRLRRRTLLLLLVIASTISLVPASADADVAALTPRPMATVDPDGSLADFSPVWAVVEANGRCGQRILGPSPAPSQLETLSVHSDSFQSGAADTMLSICIQTTGRAVQGANIES